MNEVSRQLRPFHGLFLAMVFCIVALTSGSAFAGELKFGKEPLKVDDAGKLTAEARNAAVTTLENVPGEDLWMLHLWARLDRPAPGPLYVEFHSKWKGKRYEVWSHEEKEFDGNKYLSLTLEIEGRNGFNKNSDYSVEIVQINERNKKVKLAIGKLKLVKVAPPKEDAPAEPEEDTEGDDELDEQDAFDSFAEDSGEEGDGDGDTVPATGQPPAVKKCGVSPTATAPWALLLMFCLGMARRRSA